MDLVVINTFSSKYARDIWLCQGPVIRANKLDKSLSTLSVACKESNLRDRSSIERRRRASLCDCETFWFHPRAETNDTVIFGNEHSARAIALRDRSCLPTDGTDKTTKFNDDHAYKDRYMCRL